MQRRNRSFRLSAEPLEERRVMDGTVNVVLSGNTLKITGDELNNLLIVKMNGANLRIEGADTNVTFNGITAATQVIGGLDFGKLDLKIDLKGGGDAVAVGDNQQQLIAKSLSIDTGAGTDFVTLESVAITGKTNVKTFRSTEIEGDSVVLRGSSTFLGDVRVRTGGGNDAVEMRGDGSSAIFGKRLTFDTGTGNDGVVLSNFISTGSISFKLGDGNDVFVAQNGTVKQKFDVQGGKGSEFGFINSGGNYNKLALNLGDGDDATTADGFTVVDFRVKAGKGNDTISGNALNMTQFDLFDGGVGNDTFNFTASNSTIPAAGALPKNFETQNIT